MPEFIRMLLENRYRRENQDKQEHRGPSKNAPVRIKRLIIVNDGVINFNQKKEQSRPNEPTDTSEAEVDSGQREQTRESQNQEQPKKDTGYYSLMLADKCIENMATIQLANREQIEGGDEHAEPADTEEWIMINLVHRREEAMSRADVLEKHKKKRVAERKPAFGDLTCESIFRMYPIEILNSGECENAVSEDA